MNAITKMECCSRPSIHTMDYTYPIFPEVGDPVVTKINRVCTRCFAHWFGVEGDVKQYTGKEWDAQLEAHMISERVTK